jgi:glutamate-1-semialdehyde 2,1-aminomutase
VINSILLYVVIGCALALLPKLYRRLQLSMAKHRSLAGHSKMSRRFASFVPFYEYDEAFSFAPTTRPSTLRRRGAMASTVCPPPLRNAFAKPRI